MYTSFELTFLCNPKLNLLLCNKNILVGRGQWRGGWRGGGGPRRRGGRRSRAAVAWRRGGSTQALELVIGRIMAAYQMHQDYNY